MATNAEEKEAKINEIPSEEVTIKVEENVKDENGAASSQSLSSKCEKTIESQEKLNACSTKELKSSSVAIGVGCNEHETTIQQACSVCSVFELNPQQQIQQQQQQQKEKQENEQINLEPNLPLSKTSSLSLSSVSSTASSSASASASKSVSQANTAKKTPNDFVFGKCIGEGSFSTVYLGLCRQDKREYAIKVCDKRHILCERKQVYVRREREMLQAMSHVPGFVSLMCTFQDSRSLYFVMTYAPNGELLPHIKKVGCFSVECARHYAAELVLACEQMHRRNIVHRDLKPENILLDSGMHTLIADFGSAKLLTTEDMTAAVASWNESENATTPSPSSSATSLSRPEENDDLFDDDGDEDAKETQRYRHKRTGSFVGTAQYVSPEVLQNLPVLPAADLWALGCIIYQMISGLPPFRGYNDFAIFKDILALNIEFPPNFDTDAENLVRALLKVKPLMRLGARNDPAEGYISIRKHNFFIGIDFENIREQIPPKISPYLQGYNQEENTLTENEKESISILKNKIFLIFGNKLTDSEKKLLLEQQQTDKWHYFAENEIILKKGLVNRHKGLFLSKQILLLTTGPHLIYIDPVEMIKIGEITWNSQLSVEPKNHKFFCLHTNERTHFFEDLESTAYEWVAAIEETHKLCNLNHNDIEDDILPSFSNLI